MFQKCFKINICGYLYIIPGNKAAGKQCFQLLVSKVVDSQQWRISPNNGSLDFTRCRRFDFKVTYYWSKSLETYTVYIRDIPLQNNIVNYY